MIMDFRSLPPYRGLPDSLRACGEPNEQGLLPAMRLRDYVVLGVLIVIFAPMLVPLTVYVWDEHRRSEGWDAGRRQQLQQELFRDFPGPKRLVR